MLRVATISVSATCAILAASAALADDRDVKLEDVPQAVRATIERETKGGRITEIEQDDDSGGKVRYEVEFTKDNQKWELHVAADGKVLHRERDD